MPLTYHFPGMSKEQFDVIGTPEEWPITETLIFRTMAIGIGSITEENAAEVYSRNRIYTDLYGVTELSAHAIHQRIGLKTNVTTETQFQWSKRIIADRMKQLAREYKQYTPASSITPARGE